MAKIKFTPSYKLMPELARMNEKALNIAGDLLAAEIDPFVPFATGYLSQSAFQGGKRVKQNKDTDKKVYLTYRAPYAAKLYFSVGYKFSKNSHPKAKSHWGRETFSNLGKMQRILKASYKKAQGGI